MKTVSKGSIISCVYRYANIEEVQVVEIVEVRNLAKQPLTQEEKPTVLYDTELINSKYLYVARCYRDGSIVWLFDTCMSDVVVLSDKHFTVGKLKERFDKFKKEHDAYLERLQKKEEQERLEDVIPTSGLSWQEDYERLHLDDIRNDASVEVVLFEQNEDGRCKSKHAKYSGYNEQERVVIVYHPGINIHSKIPINRIQAIYLLDDNGSKTPPDPYDGLTLNSRFHIPGYEIEQGYSDAFWDALSCFLNTDASCNKKYRFILQGGLGYFDKYVCNIQRWQDDKDIEVRLCAAHGINTKPFSLGQFQDIIALT